MPPGNVVVGSKYLDTNHMASTKFLGVYRPNNQLRTYQFYFEPNGDLFQELLPFSAAFGIPGRNTWVLSPDEFHSLRVAAGREQAPEGNAAWEQQNNQAGDEDRQWGEQGWDDYGKGHQFQQHYYQQPPQPFMQPQPGYDYVPREEYDTLVGHVGLSLIHI